MNPCLALCRAFSVRRSVSFPFEARQGSDHRERVPAGGLSKRIVGGIEAVLGFARVGRGGRKRNGLLAETELSRIQGCARSCPVARRGSGADEPRIQALRVGPSGSLILRFSDEVCVKVNPRFFLLLFWSNRLTLGSK